MDRSLDEVIQERQQRRSSRPSRDRRPPRDGIRKQPQRRDNAQNLDRDWVHDRYDDDSDSRRDGTQPLQNTRHEVVDLTEPGAKIRVDNLHYDLTEEDLRELFNRIGPVDEVDLLYDRQDRSRGVAYVVYSNMRDAKRAIQEFDGANANNQPIKLTLVPTQPAAGRPARNPFETAIVRQSRSLFERVGHIARRGRGGGSDDGSNTRHSDVSKPPPENIDRYVPGQDSGNERRRSPRPRRGDGHSRGDARRPGQRRERNNNNNNNNNNNSQGDGPAIVQGRPRKTAEELDAEMEDYWGKSANGAANNSTAAAATEEDVDMVE